MTRQWHLRLVVIIGMSACLHADQQSAPDIHVYFSPHGGCTEAVVSAVQGAQKQILVEAYSFTSKPIAIALIEAKRRGVDVEVILDKSQETAKGSNANLICKSGIPTFIDSAYRIAHDKVMIIDRARVITGSFNFTRSAEEYNAENMLVISDALPLTNQYTANWKKHLAQSKQYHPRQHTN